MGKTFGCYGFAKYISYLYKKITWCDARCRAKAWRVRVDYSDLILVSSAICSQKRIHMNIGSTIETDPLETFMGQGNQARANQKHSATLGHEVGN